MYLCFCYLPQIIRNMKHLITALAATAIMTACTNGQKILVLYYSQTGTTKSVAESFSTQLGAEYLFNVANGTTIYVTVTDGQAEFTQVVR